MRGFDPVPIATRLAIGLMRVIDDTDVEPPLWQVDANLRPEGRNGALVRTLASHVGYYERWASGWEFQALLKAWPLAGDLELGSRYVEALRPRVWQASAREDFVRDVQRMRQRVEQHIPAGQTDRQLKLGPGGLRDVEFTVQLLQLVHGRTDDRVHARATLRRFARSPSTGTSGGWRRRSSARTTACCASSSTGCSFAACSAPTSCRPTRPSCG